MKNLNILLGIFFLIIGLIGLLIPIMPTVPFLAIAAMFFSKGSEKFRIWLSKRWFYKYIREFIEEK